MQIVKKNDDASEEVLFDSASVVPDPAATITEVDVVESDGTVVKFGAPLPPPPPPPPTV